LLHRKQVLLLCKIGSGASNPPRFSSASAKFFCRVRPGPLVHGSLDVDNPNVELVPGKPVPAFSIITLSNAF
jgi:hypothetical protein